MTKLAVRMPTNQGDPVVMELPACEFTTLLAEIAATFFSKNHDYSGANEDFLANFRKSEEVNVPMINGVLVRMSDKWCRIQSLMKNRALVKTESIKDTVTDLAVYSMICRLAIEDVEKSAVKAANQLINGKAG